MAQENRVEITAMDQLRPIFWTSELGIGVKTIDDEHKLLLSIFNDLVAALRTDRPQSTAQRVIEELGGYTDYHFHHEEQLMLALGFPGLEEHRREHARLSERLAGLRQDLSAARLQLSELVDFVRALVSSHFMRTDRRMAEFLQTALAGQSPDLIFQQAEDGPGP
jgi:hemerythrin-like metal-binding protein